MGLIKQAGDLVYTFRFLRLLTTSFEDTEAFKNGIIDAEGNRLKTFSLDTMDNRDTYRDYYTPFHRLVFNIKKLIAKAPGGSTKFASYASALYLLKEKYNIPDNKINDSLKTVGVDSLDFLSEQSSWFVLEDKRLSPGVYKIMNSKMLNTSLEEIVNVRDKVKISERCYPIGDVFGLDVYEAVHLRTNQQIYVTIGELAR
tara:strand:+ start:938 stop:1537 length:600 start_codon:yes stop_codon:yes gene_type:complete